MHVLVFFKPNNSLGVEYNKNKQLKQHNDWIQQFLPRDRHDAIHSAVLICYRDGVRDCLSVCLSRTIKFFHLLVAYSYHSSFSCEIPNDMVTLDKGAK